MNVLPGGVEEVIAVCPEGTKVLGGGYAAPSSIRLNGNRPVTDHTWDLLAFNSGTISATVVAYARCADVAP